MSRKLPGGRHNAGTPTALQRRGFWHKVIGAPFPCGVFLTRQENLAFGNSRLVEYIGSIDTTLAGSRSGLAPIVLWYAIATQGTSGFMALCERMLDRAAYAQARLDAAGWRPRRADLSLSVVFDRPPDWVVRKWSLSTQGEYCHLYAMAHMTRERVDGLIEDPGFDQGDQGDEMYIVVSEISVLTDLARISSLHCRTDAHLLVINGRDFRTLMHELPVIATRIVETLVNRLVATGTSTHH